MEAFTRYLGIEPFLRSVFGTGSDLSVARSLLIFGFVMWFLVLLTIVNSMLLRSAVKKSPPAVRGVFARSSRRLRRVGRRVKWAGYSLLALSVVLFLMQAIFGVPIETLTVIVVIWAYFGLMLPAWLITKLVASSLGSFPILTEQGG